MDELELELDEELELVELEDDELHSISSQPEFTIKLSALHVHVGSLPSPGLCTLICDAVMSICTSLLKLFPPKEFTISVQPLPFH